MTDTDAVKREAHRIEEDSLFSSKGHFEAARLWTSLHYWIGVPAALLSAVAGASALSDAPTLAGALAIVVSALTALITFLNPSARATAHHIAGTKFSSLKHQARIFREVDAEVRQVDESFARLKELAATRDDLNQSSPQISRIAFKRARRGIEGGEANYQVDDRQ